MFVLTTEHELTKEAKRILREQFKKETGEDCIVLDLGMKVTQISVKKRQRHRRQPVTLTGP